jgi:hypothetical protein
MAFAAHINASHVSVHNLQSWIFRGQLSCQFPSFFPIELAGGQALESGPLTNSHIIISSRRN